jgi:hypothetical protein
MAASSSLPLQITLASQGTGKAVSVNFARMEEQEEQGQAYALYLPIFR